MFHGVCWCFVKDVSGQPIVSDLNVEGWREKSVTIYQPTPRDVSEDVGPQYSGGSIKSDYILLLCRSFCSGAFASEFWEFSSTDSVIKMASSTVE